MSITYELSTFLISIVVSVGIGYIYDILRACRKVFHCSTIIVLVQDVAFCLFMLIYVFYLFYYLNFVEIRLYILLAIVLGNAIYFITISKYILTINVCILTFFKDLFKKITINFK